MSQIINASEKTNILSNESKVIERPSFLEAQDENSCPTSVYQWQVNDVLAWAKNAGRCSESIINCLCRERIDGEVLMALTEEDVRDFRYKLCYRDIRFTDLKKFWLAVQMLQLQHGPPTDLVMRNANFDKSDIAVNRLTHLNTPHLHNRTSSYTYGIDRMMNGGNFDESISSKYGREINSILRNNTSPNEDEAVSSISTEGKTSNIPPEFFKTAISLGYSFLVTWITSFVMVIVHERVPDMKRYPPLPDIFLDNVPHIPWAFHMCEITGTLLFSIWSCVCIFHRYRMVLLRRFFALAGTVFLLRCVTMLITSLSVPGTHLQCNQNDYAVDDTRLTITEALELRISRAYTIWSGLGMSIQGVRTCGDYMFSGHTVALTLLNFFITEYTPRNLYFLHTLTWLLNMFGIFFILAAHEHYSIDVFVAFYITSRLFLYYHTLANNQALMSRDSNRTRIWFPMFSYFESSVNGIIPNEYDSLGTLLENIFNIIISVKDLCMLTARRFWTESSVNLVETTKKTFFSTDNRTKPNNVSTSTSTTTTTGLVSSSSECHSLKEMNSFISGSATDLISESKTKGQTRSNTQSIKTPTPLINTSVKKCL